MSKFSVDYPTVRLAILGVLRNHRPRYLSTNQVISGAQARYRHATGYELPVKPVLRTMYDLAQIGEIGTHTETGTRRWSIELRPEGK